MTTSIRRRLFSALLLFAAPTFMAAHAQNRKAGGRVTEEKAAISIATAALERMPAKERPRGDFVFYGVLREGIWTVEGMSPGGASAGAPIVELREADGKVLKVGRNK